MVSARCVCGTRGSGFVSSTADVLWMSVVRGMRGVGGVCVWSGRRGWRGGVRGLGLDFTNHVRTRGVLDVCVCLHCGGVGGIGGEWVGAWTWVWRAGVVLCLCEM